MKSNGATGNHVDSIVAENVPIGVVGSASFWVEYGDALARSTGLRVAAIANPIVGLKKDFVRRLGSPPSLPDASALIRTSKIRGLICGTPMELETIRTALAAGINVLFVSQIPASFEEIDLIAESAHRSFLLPALHRRFQNPFRLVREVVADGSIGKVERIECQLPVCANSPNGNGHASGFGGVTDHAATLDLCLWWLGDASRICADLGWEDAVRDKHLGSIIVNHANAVSIHQFTHCGGPHNVERYVIEGSMGKLEVAQTSSGRSGGDCPFRLTLTERGRASRDFSGWLPNAPSIQDTILDHFSDCIRGIDRPMVTIQEMRRTAECVAAAQLSSREHTKISLPLSRCATPYLPAAQRLSLTR